MFKTSTRRIIYRLVEIGLISGVVGVLTAPVFESLIPPILTGIIAATTKALRELLSKLKERKTQS